MKMEKMYVAPEVEVLLMEVELGFAGSGDGSDLNAGNGPTTGGGNDW